MKDISRREFVRNAVGTSITLGLPPTALQDSTRRIKKPAVALDPYALVDPELLPAIKALPKVNINAETLAAARSGPAAPPLPFPAPQPVDRKIPGPKGAPDIHVIIVDPAPGEKNRPALLHIHGGGYVLGKAAFFVDGLQKMAQSVGCVIVSVDYRLAPESHFPDSLEDNYSALRWLYANAGDLGVDHKRIAVGGESAGGGHAAMLAIAARDRAEIPIAFQVLIYPMLDDRTGSTRPVPPHIGAFVWTPQSNVFGWTSLLGVPAGSRNVPAGSVPARVENLAGLPPTFIAVGSIDLFVDEDLEYARRLIAEAIPTELHVLPGAYHGFDLLNPTASATVRMTTYWTQALRRGLGGSNAR